MANPDDSINGTVPAAIAFLTFTGSTIFVLGAVAAVLGIGGCFPMLLNLGTVGGGSPGDLMGVSLCGGAGMLVGALIRAVAGVWYALERISRR